MSQGAESVFGGRAAVYMGIPQINVFRGYDVGWKIITICSFKASPRIIINTGTAAII